MTSKQRAYLKGLAMNLEPIFQVGKSSVTPEIVNAITECFNTHESARKLYYINRIRKIQRLFCLNPSEMEYGI